MVRRLCVPYTSASVARRKQACAARTQAAAARHAVQSRKPCPLGGCRAPELAAGAVMFILNQLLQMAHGL